MICTVSQRKFDMHDTLDINMLLYHQCQYGFDCICGTTSGGGMLSLYGHKAAWQAKFQTFLSYVQVRSQGHTSFPASRRLNKNITHAFPQGQASPQGRASSSANIQYNNIPDTIYHRNTHKTTQIITYIYIYIYIFIIYYILYIIYNM